MKRYISVSAVLVVALSTFGLTQQQAPSSKETLLALPCFKLSTQEEFEKAEQEVTRTVQLPKRSKDGPVWLQSGSRWDPTDTSGNPQRVLGIDVRGAATYVETRAGVLLRCKLVYEDGKTITKYYAPAGPLDEVDKTGRGAKDSAFVCFPPQLCHDVNHVDVTVLTLAQGHRTKYVGSD